MIVSEVMKKDVATCSPIDDLAAAAKIMHEHYCGFVPVVDSRGIVAGVLTDRDVVSIDDVIQAPHRRGNPKAEDIVAALKGITAPRPIETVSA
jgi:CBS domain-containing protein